MAIPGCVSCGHAFINNMLWMPSEEYEKEDAEESLKKAEWVLSAARGFYKYWFLREEE